MYLNAEEMPYLRKLRGQAARQELRRQQAEAARGRAQKIGLRVKVLVAGVFNDPHHRALPWTNPGDEIEVASGPYADSLIRDGFVESLETPETVQAPKTVDLAALTADDLEAMEAPAETEDAEPVNVQGSAEWQAAFATLDAPASLKRRLWDAGFTGRESLRQRYLQHGFAPLLEIKGVNRSNALRIMVWAGELEEILVNDLSNIA